MPDDGEEVGPRTPGGRGRLARLAASILSVALCVGLTVVYAVRPDACAAVTVFPPWVWLAPGLALSAPDVRGPRRRVAWLVPAAWLVFLFAFAEEPWSLGRALARPGLAVRPSGEVVRVISINCAGGSRRAAEEAGPYRPDVVLLQESPNRKEVEELAGQLFGADGGFVHGVDASMVVRGRAEAVELPSALRGYFVQARVTLANGRTVKVVSTRLIPAVFRVDLWSPDCWREQAENRRRRREQLRTIAKRVEVSRDPVIVGGDFNAPQGDAVFRLFRPRLRDAFAGAGLGWGDTILNDVPVLRIDQVWHGKGLRPLAVVARRTRNSDHRMVICDLSFDDAPMTKAGFRSP